MVSIELPPQVLTVELSSYEEGGYEGTEVDVMAGGTIIATYRINNWDVEEATYEALTIFGERLRGLLNG